MQLKTTTVQFDQGQVSDLPAVITVQEANAVQGMRRELLRSLAFARQEDGSMAPVEKDTAIQMLRLLTYPDCMAGAIHFEGMKDPTFEEFCNLPSLVVDQWCTAVYELNPSWSGKKQETSPDEQKKATRSGSK